MAFVPLAPLYGYVAGHRRGEGVPRHRRAARRDVPAARRGMEVGACGWSAQISGERRQRAARLRRHADGDRLMTEREIVAFSRALRRARAGRGADDGLARHRGAASPAESGRPVIWNGLRGRRRARTSTARGDVLAPRRAASGSPTTTRRRGCASSPRRSRTNFVSEFTFEDYNLLDTIPAWKDALLGTVEEKHGEARRPRAPQGDEGDPRSARRAVRRRLRARPRSR